MRATTAPITGQRSTKGCWTCRLRRKKCDEEGMPCQTCATRNIHCHGYGPKPTWKDRGDKEREQAEALKLRRTSRVSRDSRDVKSLGELLSQPHPVSAASSRVQPLAPGQPPPPITSITKSLSPPATPKRSPTTLSSLSAIGIADAPDDASSRLFVGSPSVSVHSFGLIEHEVYSTTSGPGYEYQQQDLQSEISLGDDVSTSLSPNPHLSFLETVHYSTSPSGPIYPSRHQINAIPRLATSGILQASNVDGEREACLITHYLGKGFKVQFRHFNAHKAEHESGWLLLFLMRSTPFYYASLSISALYLYLSLPGRDNNARTRALQDFQAHRVRAIIEMRGLLNANDLIAPSGFLRATEILACAMQLTLLELFSGSSSSWQTYLQTATFSLTIPGSNYYPPPSAGTTNNKEPEKTQETPVMSSAEQKILELFRGTMLWVDILSSSLLGSTTPAAPTYHAILSAKSGLIKLNEIMDCENWVMILILEITTLEDWKRTRECNGSLSLHELVSRSHQIERNLRQGSQKISESNHGTLSAPHQSTSTTTYMFACAALVYLHVVVSGGSPGVPEVRKSVAKAVSAFRFLPASHDLCNLMWPYCIVGCMAINEERDVFRNLIDSIGPEARIFDNVAHIKAVLENCWGEGKTADAPCDWRASMKKLDLRVLLI